jgi:hypothetical protein
VCRPGFSYLEIGAWRGESLLQVAEYAAECVSVSLPDERVNELHGESYMRQNKLFLKSRQFAKDNILMIDADSLAYDFAKLNRKFDLIFIDGDHSCAGVKSDTANAFSLLKNDGSVIVWHDYSHWPDGKENSEVIAGILAGTPEPYKKYLYHVSNTLCAIFLKQDLPSCREQCPAFPNKVFEVQLKAMKFQ